MLLFADCCCDEVNLPILCKVVFSGLTKEANERPNEK